MRRVAVLTAVGLALAACQGSPKAKFCAVQLSLPAGAGANIGGTFGSTLGSSTTGQVVGALVQANLNGLCPVGTTPMAPTSTSTSTPTPTPTPTTTPTTTP